MKLASRLISGNVKFYSVIPIVHKKQVIYPSKISNGISRPNPQTFLGIYEDMNSSIEEIEKTLHYPVRIIGTRKPWSHKFFSWDFNFAFFRDFLNPDIFITFMDAEGKVVGPVAYRGRLNSYGPKFELGFRLRRGNIRELMEREFNRIPTKIYVSRGLDFGLSFVGIGFSFTFLEIPDSSYFPARASFVGVGNAFGISRVKAGYFERLPYLFKPRWEEKEKAIFYCYIAIILILIVYSLSLLNEHLTT